MQEAVKENGFDAEIIHYTKKNGTSAVLSKSEKIKGRVLHPFKTLDIINNKIMRKKAECVRRTNSFVDFGAYKFNLSRTCNDLNDAENIGKKYDALICGSDQIWNPTHTNCDPVYFLQFSDKEKIAYAPSISLKEIPEKYKSDFNNYVNSFSCLSVREYSGAEIIEKETGRKCENVVDPTLMFDSEKWNEIACDRVIEGDYVLCYFLGYTEAHRKLIEKVKKKFNIKIVSIPFTYKCSKNKNCENYFATIEEFLALVRDASFVITDSFHGVAFSTNYRKNFAVLKRTDTHSDKHLRVNDYLEKIGLSDRVVTEKNMDDFDFSEIDYSVSGEKLEKWVQKSRSFFADSLKKCTSEIDKKSENNILDNFMNDCYGCSACMAVCPTDAIKMVKNERGFLFPDVDNEKCIHCGKCLKKCEINKENVSRCDEIETENYIAWIKDEEELLKSSSGGMFYVLAEEFLKRGGYVCGAVYSDDFRSVRHIVSDNPEDIKKMRGSKYLQSDKENVFREIKDLLKNGEKVFFTGAPCETAALRTFIGENENLLTMSYICHGPNSPEILKSYAEELEEKFGSKLTGFTTRYKNDEKLLPLHIKANFENGEEYITEYPSSSISRIFMSGYAMRNSCLSCKFKCFPPFSDIYVGDVHGKYLDVASYNEKGASYVFTSTKKGKEILNSVKGKLNFADADFDTMVRNRNNILYPVNAPHFKKCDEFWRNFKEIGMEPTVEKMLPKRNKNGGMTVKVKILIKKALNKFI